MNSPVPASELRVASPSSRNAQQSADASESSATPRETDAQPTSLKALALLALSRNTLRNTARNELLSPTQQPETTPPAPVAHDTDQLAAACQRLRIDSAPILQTIGPEDLRALTALSAAHPDPAGFADAYVIAIRDRLTLDAGRVPPSYTAPAICDGCGPVLLWPELAAQSARFSPNGRPVVMACPWCFQRRAHRPVPRPDVHK